MILVAQARRKQCACVFLRIVRDGDGDPRALCKGNGARSLPVASAQLQRERVRGWGIAWKLRRFNNKGLGDAPQSFTAFGVWPRFGARAKVNVQMRFAHRFDQQGQRSTNCLRPDRPSFSELRRVRPRPIQLEMITASKMMSEQSKPPGRPPVEGKESGTRR
jgi:hypothetical protein